MTAHHSSTQFPKKPTNPLQRYIRGDRLPNVWCAGCGIGTLLNSTAQAIHNLKLDMDKLVMISGIGCSGRFGGYFESDGFHTTHGRAIPLATGVKLTNPNLEVVVVSGDGDLFAIGGNHFIHAARRNINMTVVCLNNLNYGMTGGQLGPTSPNLSLTSTSKFGNIEHPFNLVQLAAGAGAVYVARWTTYHVKQLQRAINRGIQKKGFSFIEVVAPCLIYYERYNAMSTPVELMQRLKDISTVSRSQDPQDAVMDYPNKIVCGEFVNIKKPEYTTQMADLIKNARQLKSGRKLRRLGRRKE
ncbi:MAG: thiamine pyrophosphate-dependent enzyme [Candidatus Ranarchaeia archaeon]|jgi:2-oxoglutarate ferredoxin oxidoreductase subunit beta